MRKFFIFLTVLFLFTFLDVLPVSAYSKDRIYVTEDPSKVYDGERVTDPSYVFTGEDDGTATYTYYDRNQEGAQIDAPKDAGSYTVRVHMENSSGFRDEELYDFTIKKKSVYIDFYVEWSVDHQNKPVLYADIPNKVFSDTNNYQMKFTINGEVYYYSLFDCNGGKVLAFDSDSFEVTCELVDNSNYIAEPITRRFDKNIGIWVIGLDRFEYSIPYGFEYDENGELIQNREPLVLSIKAGQDLPEGCSYTYQVVADNYSGLPEGDTIRLEPQGKSCLVYPENAGTAVICITFMDNRETPEYGTTRAYVIVHVTPLPLSVNFEIDGYDEDQLSQETIEKTFYDPLYASLKFKGLYYREVEDVYEGYEAVIGSSGNLFDVQRPDRDVSVGLHKVLTVFMPDTKVNLRNYTYTLNQKFINIVPRVITLTVEDAEGYVGDEEPEYTYKVEDEYVGDRDINELISGSSMEIRILKDGEYVSSYDTLEEGTYTIIAVDKDGNVPQIDNCTLEIVPGTLTINPKKVIPPVDSVSLSTSAVTYNGKKRTPSVIVKDTEGKALVKDQDYTVSYESGRTLPGIYKITVTGKGDYTFTKTLSFTINPVKTTVTDLVNGTTGVKVSWNKVTGVNGYKIYRKVGSGSYKALKTIYDGSAVSFVDTGACENGTKYAYYVVAFTKTANGTVYAEKSDGKATYYVSQPAISALENPSAGKMVVRYSKVKGSGYQIEYCTSSSFNNCQDRLVPVTGYKTVAKAITGLSKSTKYYVRVRAYKTVSGVNYYSAWSDKKAITIKK